MVLSVVTGALGGLIRREEAAEDSLLFPLVRGGVGVGREDFFSFFVVLNRTCRAGLLTGVSAEGGGGGPVQGVLLRLLLWMERASVLVTSTTSSSSSRSPTWTAPASGTLLASSRGEGAVGV